MSSDHVLPPSGSLRRKAAIPRITLVEGADGEIRTSDRRFTNDMASALELIHDGPVGFGIEFAQSTPIHRRPRGWPSDGRQMPV